MTSPSKIDMLTYAYPPSPFLKYSNLKVLLFISKTSPFLFPPLSSPSLLLLPFSLPFQRTNSRRAKKKRHLRLANMTIFSEKRPWNGREKRSPKSIKNRQILVALSQKSLFLQRPRPSDGFSNSRISRRFGHLRTSPTPHQDRRLTCLFESSDAQARW